MNESSFLLTKEHKRFVEFCEACRKYKYIGICYGPPGVGKTISAKQYANWDVFNDFLLGKKVNPKSEIPSQITHCKTIYYTAPVVRTGKIEHNINLLGTKLNLLIEERMALEEKREIRLIDWYQHADLVIIDEADRLQLSGLEQARDLYDQNPIGLVLIGMPGLEKRLARYPQLYSRVGFANEFKKLHTDELRHILEYKWRDLGLRINFEDFTDYEAFSTLARITGGNFRLIHRIFTQIERIMEINNLTSINKEVVETARESLVIGKV